MILYAYNNQFSDKLPHFLVGYRLFVAAANQLENCFCGELTVSQLALLFSIVANISCKRLTGPDPEGLTRVTSQAFCENLFLKY